MPTPSVGRIVHYVSHGTPIRNDGSQAFTSQCRAAIITGVYEGSIAVDLMVANPTGLFFNTTVPNDEDNSIGGTWHWPERTAD